MFSQEGLCETLMWVFLKTRVPLDGSEGKPEGHPQFCLFQFLFDMYPYDIMLSSLTFSKSTQFDPGPPFMKHVKPPNEGVADAL